MIVQHLQNKEKFVTALKGLFHRWDRHGTGHITREEFEHHMKDENMQVFLQTLEIEVPSAYTLFTLLDADGGGTLDVEEFIDGLIALRGTAKSIQMHELSHDLRKLCGYVVAMEEKRR